MRSALRVPYSAPQMASASALINVCTNAVSIDRNRSGSACCSCSSTAGTSIGLRLAVIVVISPSGELGGSTKDHCGDRFHQLRHTDQRQAVHHVPGLLYRPSSTRPSAWELPHHMSAPVRRWSPAVVAIDYLNDYPNRIEAAAAYCGALCSRRGAE